MWGLIFSNIRQRPTRSCVSIFAVALGVVLIQVSVGLSYGVLNEQGERSRRIGGDFVLQSSGASVFFALNSGTMPARLAGVATSVEGVEAATPILVKFVSQGFLTLFGVEKESFFAVNDELTLVEGEIFDEPREAIVDTLYARVNQVEIGQTLELLGDKFRVSGIFRQGIAGRILVPLQTLQEMNGTPDKVTMFFIRASDGRSLDEVEANLMSRFQNYKLTRTERLPELLTANAPVYKEFQIAIVCIAVTVSFLVILLTMYSTIVERTREIGILKSLGASRKFIVRIIVEEALVVSGLGVIFGFILTAFSLQIITAAFPMLHVIILPIWRVACVVFALVGGTLGALYPAVKAARLDPVQALGYE